MRSGQAINALGRGKQAAAKLRLFIDQDHARAAVGGGTGGREAGRTCTNHQDIAVRVDVVVAIGIRLGGRMAQTGGMAENMLVERPEAARPHEGLVVEAGWHERGHEAERGHHVVVEAGPGVDVAHVQSSGCWSNSCQTVRQRASAVAELDEGVGVFSAGGHDSARPVVLEAAADEGDAIGEQRRGHGVAVVSADRTPVEGELEKRVAINAASAVQTEGLTHGELP